MGGGLSNYLPPEKGGGGIYQRGSLIRRFTVCKSSRLTQPVLTKFFQSATIISKRFDSYSDVGPSRAKT